MTGKGFVLSPRTVTANLRNGAEHPDLIGGARATARKNQPRRLASSIGNSHGRAAYRTRLAYS